MLARNEMKKLSLQFLRYIVVGASGTIIYAIIFGFLNETVLSVDIQLSDFDRGVKYALANSIPFLVSSVFVYIANRNWVFTAGHHNRSKEIILFYVVAFVAFLIGTLTGALLVAEYNWNEYAALSVTIGASVLINFAGRKLIVFKG